MNAPVATPRLLLVDNDAAMRSLLSGLLESEGLAVIAQASNKSDALACLNQDRPDLALVDLSLGEGNGLEVVVALHAAGVPVLVCSSHEEHEYVRRAMAAGARGYITKREANRNLARAVRDVSMGWLLISPRAADEFMDEV